MGSDVTLESSVEAAALELVQRHDFEEIETLLVQVGHPIELVRKMLLLIPSAFARAHFEPQGIEFVDQFSYGAPGRAQTGTYASEPIYQSARKLAQRWTEESRLSLVMRVLDWSAEAKCIREAGERGLTPTRVGGVHHGFDS